MSRTALNFAIAVAITGCAKISKESIEFSNIVGRDFNAIQVSHQAGINRYFDNMEALFNRRVDQVRFQEAVKDHEKLGIRLLSKIFKNMGYDLAVI